MSHWERGGKATGTCEICATQFEYYPSDKLGQFCSKCVETENWRTKPVLTGSDNPRWNGGKHVLGCAVCSIPVERYPSNIPDSGVVTCSETCRREWLSDAFTGSNHPNWKGGDTGPYGPGWAAVRRAAIERDNNLCRCCGTTHEELGRNPDVHHIIPVRTFVESGDHDVTDAHYLANVVSLCPSCHRKADFGKIPESELRQYIEVSEKDDPHE